MARRRARSYAKPVYRRAKKTITKADIVKGLAGLAVASYVPGLLGTGISYLVGGVPAAIGNYAGPRVMGMASGGMAAAGELLG